MSNSYLIELRDKLQALANSEAAYSQSIIDNGMERLIAIMHPEIWHHDDIAMTNAEKIQHQDRCQYLVNAYASLSRASAYANMASVAVKMSLELETQNYWDASAREILDAIGHIDMLCNR